MAKKMVRNATTAATAAKRLAAQQAKAARELEVVQASEREARLAQIANLLIAGHSLGSIAVSIGCSSEELDRMINEDMQRYIRSSGALRQFVRNWANAKYSGLLESVYDTATDKNAPTQLEHQDRALRVIDRIVRLNGAEAPAQSEVKIDGAPEAVSAMVAALAAGRGLGYNENVFDVVPGDVVSAGAVSGNQQVREDLDKDDEDDE